MHTLEEVITEKQIAIDGKFVTHYKSIEINQSIGNHHTFKVTLDLETVEKTNDIFLDNSKKWLGKKFVAEVYSKAFIGIILDVSVSYAEGYHGIIVLTGASHTILLESGKQQRSWLGKNLKYVIKQIVEETPIKYKINPLYGGEIPYQCQYLESGFQYLQRLAHQYNEWFYFNGFELVFGKPKERGTPIVLDYGSDIFDFELKLNTYQPHFSTYSYDAFNDKMQEGKIKGDFEGLNDLANQALNSSKELYKGTVISEPSDVFLKDKYLLDMYLKERMMRITSQGNILSAKSHKRGITLGSIIKVGHPEFKLGVLVKMMYREYIVIEIVHKVEDGGKYGNEFKAVPSSVNNLPINEDVKPPVAHTQIGTVVSNDDPKQKGRVQVKLQWQKDNMKTDWLRVITPDGGKSEKTPTNRGFVFIPEKDDQVMVGFEHNDPNRPFVLGSLFTGKTGAGGDKDNIKKSITTRSGNTVVLDDKKGSITIADPSGNTVVMKGNGEILIHAPNKLTLASTDINVMASNSISLISRPSKDKNGNSNGEGTIDVVAKKLINVQAEEETIKLVSKQDVGLKSNEAKVAIEGKSEVGIHSSDKMLITGKDVTTSAKSKNKVSGGKVQINQG